MAHASYTNDTNVYTVHTISEYNNTDAEDALLLVNYDVDDVEAYKSAMKDSVQQGLAYEIYKDAERVGYVYNRMVGDVYTGCSINIQDYEAMAIAFKHMFEVCDKHKIVFKPHGGNVHMFKGLLSGTALRTYNNGKDTVSVLRKDVEEKGYKVFMYMGLKEVV